MTDKDQTTEQPLDENKLIAQRREKLQVLRDAGNAFPNDFRRDALAAEIHAEFGDLTAEEIEQKKVRVKLAGRMMAKRIMIYLDYAATTPVHPRVLDAMLPYFRESYGNPSSVHRYGQKAESALEAAREKVAAVLHCRPDEIIFTSCGSESDNLALRGAAFAKRKTSGKKWILTARNEHHAVSRTAEQLEKEFGFLLEWLDLDETER